MPLDSALTKYGAFRPGVCTSTTRPANPATGQVIYETDKSRTLVWSGTAWIPVGENVVTSLPSSPLDGEVIRYVADATNGIVWTFKYRSASSSSYKWEFVGGDPLVSTAAATVTSVALTTEGKTGGPSVTVPFAGDYMVDCGATMNSANSGNLAGFYVKGTGDADQSWTSMTCNYHSATGSAQTTYGTSCSAYVLKTGQSASQVIEMRYAGSNTGSTNIFYNRYMKVTPVRVG